MFSEPTQPRSGPDLPPVLLELDPIYEQPAPGGEGRRRRHRPQHRKRRMRPRVRMRFAWWHLVVALALIALGGWLVLAMQPWHVRKMPPVWNQT